MLKYRLLFGTLMALLFTSIVIFDGWLDGSLTEAAADKPVQGTILCILVALVAIPASLEFGKLASAKNARVFTPVTIIASILVATTWYWPQLGGISAQIYLPLVLAFSLMAIFLFQGIFYGTAGVIANCGASCFSIVYLGLFSAFIVAIRVELGIWHLLMSIFVVKCSDIGAFTAGKLLGKHKFAPKISPGKTWEGMAGAVAASIMVSVIFADRCGIMSWQLAVLFGLCFAFIGQLGDLAESMIKRDAEQKDSAKHVPGFGGILDVIDSPLVAAVFAYAFFLCINR